jgi:steroid delta-isomerase-like uncharacterized protein
MSEREKEIARRFIEEVFNNHNLGVIDELMTEDFVEHDPLPGLTNDRDGTRETLRAVLGGFPDIRADVVDAVSEGDRVAIRTRYTGTHHGEFMGVPATGRQSTVESIDIIRMTNDGLAAEHWGVFDTMGVMLQIGVIEQPQAAEAPTA